jgi:hypothetical protein
MSTMHYLAISFVSIAARRSKAESYGRHAALARAGIAVLAMKGIRLESHANAAGPLPAPSGSAATSVALAYCTSASGSSKG